MSHYLYLQQNELHVGNCDTLQRIYLNIKDRSSLKCSLKVILSNVVKTPNGGLR